MSPLALRILDLFIDHAKGRNNHKEDWYERYQGYIAGWSLKKLLAPDANINGVDVKIAPKNEYQRALRELIDLGIVQEKPDLPERFELVVHEPKKEQEKPIDPIVAEYWTYPPKVQGELRKKVDQEELFSDL
jgi:hypothetical protein